MSTRASTDVLPGIHLATVGEETSYTPQISTEEMRRILIEGSALIVDSRPRPQFAAGYIPGAICLDTPPPEQVQAVRRIVGDGTSRPIVVYCNGPNCQQSRRLAHELATAGYRNVRRYQLGISVWRVLGGPTAVETSWVERVIDHDETAVLIDARPAAEHSAGSLPRARHLPVDEIAAGNLEVSGMPHDDFNRRIILFGRHPEEARRLAEILAQRPWANVSFVDAGYAELARALLPQKPA